MSPSVPLQERPNAQDDDIRCEATAFVLERASISLNARVKVHNMDIARTLVNAGAG
ncbi:hypothetical protein LL962_04690 [Xanthomonas sp. NCPPB 1067]|uniref:hypothetical protein n=1 Tax=Xanthomonas sp. NCPPB 1067 TaxID=487524 RepID=UPI001E36BCA8|nr:hypothetical protein [Xanthomonas sp. NCPPB 1067]MCC4586413.1 hypothetical protein [Xanthomonas sp. NCPPB 1067]